MTRTSCVTSHNCHPYFQCSVSKMNLAARACRHLPSLRQFNSDPRQRRQGSFQSESNILPFSLTPFRTSSTSPGSVIPSCAPRCSLRPSGLSRGRESPTRQGGGNCLSACQCPPFSVKGMSLDYYFVWK